MKEQGGAEMNAGTADPSAAAMAATTTFVMVGKTGTGKSATGNLLLGREDAFKSSSSVVGVTSKCKLEETADGSLAVIDTPGLSDDSSTVGELFQEIGRSVELAGPGGITAIIIVLSLSTRVTEEDLATIELLAAIFSGTPTSGYANDKMVGCSAIYEQGSSSLHRNRSRS
jgi:predicted GTPase